MQCGKVSEFCFQHASYCFYWYLPQMQCRKNKAKYNNTQFFNMLAKAIVEVGLSQQAELKLYHSVVKGHNHNSVRKTELDGYICNPPEGLRLGMQKSNRAATQNVQHRTLSIKNSEFNGWCSMSEVLFQRVDFRKRGALFQHGNMK